MHVVLLTNSSKFKLLFDEYFVIVINKHIVKLSTKQSSRLTNVCTN